MVSAWVRGPRSLDASTKVQHHSLWQYSVSNVAPRSFQTSWLLGTDFTVALCVITGPDPHKAISGQNARCLCTRLVTNTFCTDSFLGLARNLQPLRVHLSGASPEAGCASRSTDERARRVATADDFVPSTVRFRVMETNVKALCVEERAWPISIWSLYKKLDTFV